MSWPCEQHAGSMNNGWQIRNSYGDATEFPGELYDRDADSCPIVEGWVKFQQLVGDRDAPGHRETNRVLGTDP